MIVEWLQPFLAWSGLSVGTLLLSVLILVIIFKD